MKALRQIPLLLAAMTCAAVCGTSAVSAAEDSPVRFALADAVRLFRYMAECPDGDAAPYDLDADGAVTLLDWRLMAQSLDTAEEETWILEPKGTVHTGEATFYGGGYEGGCAMLDPVSTDHWITAMNIFDYNTAELAGAYLEVTGELGTIHVLVTDLLPEGKKGDLDLYVDAFPLIAPAEKGRVPVSWKIIPLDTAENAPMQYRYKEGSSPYWCGVQVLNHRYPIETLEVRNADGTFTALPRQNYNYFLAESGLGEGPFTFRITDIYGQSVIDENIPFTPDETQTGSAQLPL